jgi:hypothetical protein
VKVRSSPTLPYLWKVDHSCRGHLEGSAREDSIVGLSLLIGMSVLLYEPALQLGWIWLSRSDGRGWNGRAETSLCCVLLSIVDGNI